MAFFRPGEKSRGWPACAGHDTEGARAPSIGKMRSAGARPLLLTSPPGQGVLRPTAQREARRTMIKRFHVLYVGQIDLDNVGLNGTPANDRRYSNERLSEAFLTARDVARVMDELGYYALLDRRAPFPARRLRVPAQPDPARPVARHADQAAQVRLRLQRAADVASDPPGGRLRHGRHRHRRPRHHGRRPRLPHARGGNLRRAADRRRRRTASISRSSCSCCSPASTRNRSTSRASISSARRRWTIAATS